MLCCSVIALLLGQSGAFAGAVRGRMLGDGHFAAPVLLLVQRYRVVLGALLLLELTGAVTSAPAMLAWDGAGRSAIAGSWPICAFGRLVPGDAGR